ncbi:NERD domain-containing protein [Isoptericola sp. b490]|uniref:NERD domain-containing protein n=1 Tax=Actinotalea lenta TaxID=3064654 RepID=UPI00271242CA|nr:NERD domain-containing protein [Isoptericola sp. b490]MDO8119716.1 NERD domain-containing protein [Isoptericola sp. b490]
MKLVPPVDRLGRVESSAERRVASLLDQIELDEPATCFYSVHLPRHEYKRMAEIDFLLVLEGLLLVVEVKGGRLARKGGVWTFTDRYGDVHEKREGPFDQARTAAFALEHDLSSRAPQLDPKLGWIVVTPDQVLEPDVEWDPAEYIGGNAMSLAGLRDGIARAAKFWRARSRRKTPSASYRELVGLLRPNFDRVPKLSLTASAFEAEYVALASEQYAMLRGSELNDRVFCIGGAGSGKTLLAVESARRAAAEGAKVLLTCRSPGVVDLMSRSLSGTAVDCEVWSNLTGPEPYDLLVVDEAQDLLNLDDYVRLDELVDGGLTGGRWRIFCDPNNQANVDGAFDTAIYDELRKQGAIYQLPYNCRNTSAIINQTQLLTGADLGVARVGEGPQVEFVHASDDEDSAAKVDSQLGKLREEEIDPTDIVVVTLRSSVDRSSAALTRAWSRRRLVDGDSPANEGRRTRLVTTRAFKGLEAAHVLVVDVDDVSSAAAMARLYVAMTRPRVSLWLAVRDEAWEQLAATGKERS